MNGRLEDGALSDALEPALVDVPWAKDTGKTGDSAAFGLGPFVTRLVAGGDHSVLFDEQGEDARRIDHRSLGKTGVSLPFCLTLGKGPREFFENISVLLYDYLEGKDRQSGLFL